MSEETRKRLSIINKGKKFKLTPEQIEKRRQKMLGRAPWNKGLNKYNNEILAECSRIHKGKPGNHYKQSDRAKEKIRQANIGRIVITDGNIKKRINPNQYEYYESLGFYRFHYNQN